MSRGNPVPDSQFLPPTGIIITYSERPVCAGFLFKTDARIAIINHVVSNPAKIDPGKRSSAIDLLISTLVHAAYSSGFKMVTAASNKERLNKRYEKLGFVRTDTDEVHYGRVL